MEVNDIADILCSISKRGVRMWVEDGRVRYKAHHGALTPVELETLRASKAEIATFLEQVDAVADRLLTARQPNATVPLTFGQQLTWRILNLRTRRSVRTVSTAMRLLGQLRVEALSLSFFELVRRHESLRTRLVAAGDAPIQVVDDAEGFHFEILDLTATSEDDVEARARRVVEDLANEQIDVAVGPLFAAKLVKLKEHEHVLVISVDMLISDGASLEILWRDVSTMYRQAVSGVKFALPGLTVQFADYAIWEQGVHKLWTIRHRPYWCEYLADTRRVRIFNDDRLLETPESRIGRREIDFGESLSVLLRQLSSRERIPLAIAVFTAIVAFVCRWCDTTDLVAQIIVPGRTSAKLENVIGCFTSGLCLRIHIHESDDFMDVLNQVNQEYCRSYEHFDSCRMAAEVPMPEFARSLSFDWVPQQFNIGPAAHVQESQEGGLGAGIRMEPFPFRSVFFDGVESPFDDIDVDNEPVMFLSDANGTVSGCMTYCADKATPDTAERFVRGLVQFSELLAKEPRTRLLAISNGIGRDLSAVAAQKSAESMQDR